MSLEYRRAADGREPMSARMAVPRSVRSTEHHTGDWWASPRVGGVAPVRYGQVRFPRTPPDMAYYTEIIQYGFKIIRRSEPCPTSAPARSRHQASVARAQHSVVSAQPSGWRPP